jgi:hypothetical protein
LPPPATIIGCTFLLILLNMVAYFFRSDTV